MNNIIKRTWNQNRMVNIESLQGMAFQAESGGHTFEIYGVNDAGETVALSGTVTGVFMRPDSADIALTGTASDGIASVTLTDDCYAVNGRFGFTIFVTDEQNQKVAVYACVGTVTRSSTGGVAGSTPQDVVDLINAINAAVATIPADYTDLMAAIAPTYSNTALYAVGSYAWYDGVLYKCTTAITTAESWTAEHWTAAAVSNDVSLLTKAVGEMGEIIYPKNKFNKNDYQVINANINSSTNKLVSNTALRTVYLRIKPNTTYTVSKMVSARFIIAFTDAEIVANGVDCTGVVYNNAASKLTSTSGANSKWILVLCYSTSADTETLADVLSTLQIEEGNEATTYENYFDPYYTANDQKARDDIDALAESTSDSLSAMNQLIETKSVINFADLFSLSDTYIDDLYGRQDFSDSDHVYTKFGTATPTIDPTGAYTNQGVGVAIYTRSIERFPFFFSVGKMDNAYMQICFKVKAATSGQFERVRFDPSTGIVLYESSALGYFDCKTNWLFFEVMPNAVTMYDDSGNRLVAPVEFSDTDPKNYGIYFGATYKYGITSVAEWAVKHLNSLDAVRAIGTKSISGLSHYMDTFIYSRSYISGGQRYTVSNPGDQYVKVITPTDDDPTIEYTNNPILRCQMDWSDGTYRSEIGITGTLPYDSILQRHEASIDYYIPSVDNPESGTASEQFDTYILQIHDLYFSATGWLDPPPVFVTFKGGKLYATVCYIENGEIPTQNSIIKQDKYYLCDVPNGWFTLGLKLRTAYKAGFSPYLTISINGVDKLNVYTPIGFNIYRDGGLTRLTFGLYAPNWAYQEYSTAHRKVYIANVKYKY